MTQPLPATESHNPATAHIDAMSPLEIAAAINAEDARVAAAVGQQLPVIAQAIERIAAALRDGGRLIYLGAGTSGRLGVLDAAECPPTFNTDPQLVVGLIAGGPEAMCRSVEGAEDRGELAVEDLRQRSLHRRDVVVGIATGGRTPYVLAGVDYAREIGAATIGLACTADSQLEPRVDLMIGPIVGPEVLSGSTRLKAGTATKMVLNMLSTAVMVRLGKTYGHRMVDLRASNSKLRDRALRILMELTGLDRTAASALLDACGGELKTAIVAHRRALPIEDARTALQQAEGHLRRVLDGR